MGLFLSNRDDGKTDELGHNLVLKHAFSGDIISGFIATQAGTPGLSIEVGEGYALVTDGEKKFEVWSDATETLAIATPNVSNPRIDLLVGYVDLDEAVQNTIPNNEDIFKLAVVEGTPAGSPSAPSAGQIQSAIGASNPYVIMYEIAVGAGVTTITNGNLTDRRSMVGLDANSIKEVKANSFILYDADGNEYVKLSKVASAVNELTLKNAATGNAPEIQATGGDTNIDLNLVSKGSGEIQLNGADMSGAWETWSPTYSNLTIGNGIVTAKFKRIGKTVHFRFLFQLGTTSSVGTTPTISLPFTAASGYSAGAIAENANIGVSKFLDSGNANFFGYTYMSTNTTFSPQGVGTSATYATAAGLNASIPFTWGTGDAMFITGTYEMA